MLKLSISYTPPWLSAHLDSKLRRGDNRAKLRSWLDNQGWPFSVTALLIGPFHRLRERAFVALFDNG